MTPITTLAELAESQAKTQQAWADQWELLTPYGPMRHKVTGESYQAMSARLDHEHEKAK